MQSYPSSSQRAVAFFRMMRLPNCIMIGFAVVVGELIASSIVPVRAAFYGFMAGFLLLAASMVLNDYFDREIDAINEPQRPVPAGIVRPTEALSFAIILTSFGILFAAYSGPWTLLIALVSVGIMVAYSAKVKKWGLLGNAFVSSNVAVPFVYGGFAVGSPTWSLVIFATLAFLASMGREIMKGIVDVEGDSTKGVRSIAATKGNAQAAKASTTLMLLAVGLSILPIILGMVSVYYIPLVVICDVGLLLTSFFMMISPTPSSAKRSKTYVLVWMTFGLLAFLIGSL